MNSLIESDILMLCMDKFMTGIAYLCLSKIIFSFATDAFNSIMIDYSHVRLYVFSNIEKFEE